MIKRVNNLPMLGLEIVRGEPAEILYGLGEGRERTELLVTHMDGNNRYSARIDSSPKITLRRKNGRTLMDITDSNGETLRDTDDSDGTLIEITDSRGEVVQNAYRNLRVESSQIAVSEAPATPYELRDLVIDLEDGKKLGFTQYAREE